MKARNPAPARARQGGRLIDRAGSLLRNAVNALKTRIYVEFGGGAGDLRSASMADNPRTLLGRVFRNTDPLTR